MYSYNTGNSLSTASFTDYHKPYSDNSVQKIPIYGCNNYNSTVNRTASWSRVELSNSLPTTQQLTQFLLQASNTQHMQPYMYTYRPKPAQHSLIKL